MKKLIFLNFVFLSIVVGQEIRVVIPARVHAMLTISDGKRLGYSSSLDTILKEIPKGDYVYGSIGSIDENDNTAPDDFYELYVDDEVRGEVLLNIFGRYAGRYFVEISRRGEGRIYEANSYIQKGGEEKFFLRFEAGTSLVFRLVDSGSLRAHITVAYDAGDLGKSEFYEDLNHRTDKLERYLKIEDTSKAYHELQKLDKKLDEVYEKTLKEKSADPHHFIKEDAYWILKEDVKRLLD